MRHSPGHDKSKASTWQVLQTGGGLLSASVADWASVGSGGNEVAGATIGTGPRIVEDWVGSKHNCRAGSLHVGEGDV